METGLQFTADNNDNAIVGGRSEQKAVDDQCVGGTGTGGSIEFIF